MPIADADLPMGIVLRLSSFSVFSSLCSSVYRLSPTAHRPLPISFALPRLYNTFSGSVGAMIIEVYSRWFGRSGSGLDGCVLGIAFLFVQLIQL
jgi:hypothetical protein